MSPASRDSGDPKVRLRNTVPEGFLNLMFDSISDGIYAVDADWKVIVLNRAAEEAFGLRRSDVMGRPCHEVFRGAICRECCALRCTLETGQPVINLVTHYLDSQDRRLPVAISTAVLRSDQGRSLGGVVTFRNLDRMRHTMKEVEHNHPFAHIVTDAPSVRRIFEFLPTIANSESSVLISGETGTGKSLIARTLHNLSPRRNKPFITVNCGALPETLIESELFGYRAGAFTGATRDRVGRLAAAEGGTLFLDEIGDMSRSMQVKLLRFLQDRVYERLGDVRPIPTNVRVITATNRNLMESVESGDFRRDLYYRINVMNVEMPSLSRRREDIPLLAQRCLDRLSMQRGKNVTSFDPEVIALLGELDYPGNIRELENIIEHAYVCCQDSNITLEHLPEHLRGETRIFYPSSARNLADVQTQFILQTLAAEGWNRQKTADKLGMHKTTLLRKIKKLGIDLPAIDGRSSRSSKA